MGKNTWLWVLVGGGAAYWLYCKSKDTSAKVGAAAAATAAASAPPAASTPPGPYSTMDDPTDPANYPE